MSIQERMEECKSSIEHRWKPQVKQMRSKIERTNQKAVDLMRERPGISLLLAIGVGFLVGRMVSRH